MTQETVKIERMGYGSEGIGHLESGKTVFVAGAVAGDVAEVSLTEEKKSFARAQASRIVEKAADRVSAKPCPNPCGGCPWAALSYEAQLNWKRKNVASALVRTGHLPEERVEKLVQPCLASPRTWGYRNKIELHAASDTAGRLVLGLHAQSSNSVVPVTSCALACNPLQKAPKALQGAIRVAQGAADWGLFRVGVRASSQTGDAEVALWTNPGAFPRAQAAKTIGSGYSATSIVRVLASEGKARTVKGVEKLAGKGCWEERLNGVRYLTSAPSFFQVNSAAAELLINAVMSFIHPEKGQLVADLYAGGGTFSIPLARANATVVAVEAAGSSVRDLRRNAELNNVELEVIGGDTGRELPELGRLHAVVVDPPRAGLADGVVESIARSRATRVAYVSCDPQTLARDLAHFEACGYELRSVQPVDLFPQTYHVENVACLVRRTIS